MSRTHRLSRRGVFLVLTSVVLLTACGGGSNSTSASASGPIGSGGTRPTTTAQLEILEPTPNQQTDANVTVKFKLTGAKLAAQTTSNVKPDEGYIHLSVDDQQLEVVDTTEVPLYALTPGPHVVQGEFVAADHAPFANRPTASVAFTVK